MLVSQLKPMEEIAAFTERDNAVVFLACAGCAEVCRSADKEELDKTAEELTKKGKTVTGTITVDFLCNKSLARIKLLRNKSKWEKADSFLVFSCGVGIQAVSAVVKKVIHPATNTISLGGFQGVWMSDERCAQCGNCMLDFTGGICPYTACAKSMLNGPCGGSNKGECEVEKGRDCGWARIYERLKDAGRLEDMKKIRPLRDYSRMVPKKDIRSLVFYEIDRKPES